MIKESLERRNEMLLSLNSRSDYEVAVETAAGIVVTVLAFLGNALLCLVFCRNRVLLTPRNYLILSLAIADLLMAVFVMPSFIGAALLGRLPYGGDLVCQMNGYLSLALPPVNLLVMTLIAINRYVKMTKNVVIYRKIYSKKYTVLSVLLAWIAALIVPLSYFLLGERLYFHSGNLICLLDSDRSDRAWTFASVLYFLMALTFPVIGYCYYKVFRKVRSHFIQVSSSAFQNESARTFAKEVRITKMLFATVLAFMVCWGPPFIIIIMGLFSGEYHAPRRVYVYLFSLSIGASSVVNPFIYGIMNREFRRQYKTFLRCS